ncbi:uncharacterized oxidoreductase C736.13 [Aspergillus udagawae]|uniref:Uncharacterized oxidoreductase C736.13 n=1 Tax=Aspergillus udagawae TaxID=91492 RepID=A0A8H3RMS4_9EURO|nr:uncharacterized oxidoreductase C736.13 [Aspergillus udagawae]
MLVLVAGVTGDLGTRMIETKSVSSHDVDGMGEAATASAPFNVFAYQREIVQLEESEQGGYWNVYLEVQSLLGIPRTYEKARERKVMVRWKGSVEDLRRHVLEARSKAAKRYSEYCGLNYQSTVQIGLILTPTLSERSCSETHVFGGISGKEPICVARPLDRKEGKSWNFASNLGNMPSTLCVIFTF